MLVKERPMLYSTDMVVSILEDRKTKTRRMTGLEMVNEFPDLFDLVQVHYRFGEENPEALYATFSSDRVPDDKFDSLLAKYNYAQPTIKCPYGKLGDILWVREKFRYGQPYGPESLHYYFAGYNRSEFGPPVDADKAYLIDDYDRWRPSIHMPKVAAQIWLQITDIKVERLNDISEDDAIAEGIKMHYDFPDSPGTPYFYLYPHKNKGKRRCLGPIAIDDAYIRKGIFGIQEPARMSFRTLWDMVNGFDSWKANPWVWVVSFKVLSKTGKPVAERQEASGKEVANV